MLTRTPTKKAKKQSRKAVKRAGKASKKARKRAEKAGHEAQERAAEYAERAGEAASDAATELADRLRKSESLAKAQAKGSELASLAKDKWEDSDVEDRVADLANRVRKSEPAKRAQAKTKDVTDSSLAALGEWLNDSKTGKEIEKKLGVQKRRRGRTLLAAMIGAAAGFAIARLVGSKPLPELADDFTASAERLATGSTAVAETIRSTLDSDPRTAGLEEININVAEGTVFVRGTVPEGTDENVVRDVVSSVPGVTDVDLQLQSSAAQA